MDSSLRDRLAAVARERARWAPASGPTPPESDPDRVVDESVARPKGAPRRKSRVPPLERILPGEEISTTSGVCWRHERSLAQWPGADPTLPDRLGRRLAEPPPEDMAGDTGLDAWRALGLQGAVFLDLETTGLSATPVFLAGMLMAESGGMVFRLLLARDYTEEAALLEAVAAEIVRRPVVVTFNGKSYDLPFLRERMGRLRVDRAEPRAVLDLLHPARRRWGKQLPDCRLATLEWHLCRRLRAGDIPGKDIPAAYHRFVRDRDPRPLLKVFTHNLLDLYTLAELTDIVLSAPPRGG